MKITAQFATLVLLTAGFLPCLAQEPAPVLLDKTSQDTTTSTEVDNSALPLRERALFDRGMERPSAFTLSGQVLGMYDDDIEGSAARGGGEMVQMSLFAGFNKHWANNDFKADYSPTFDRYVQDDQLDFLSHDYDQEFEHRLSAKTQLDWTARVSRYSSRYLTPAEPERFGDISIVVPDLESLSGINQVVVTSATSQVAILHDSSPRDTWSYGVMGGTSRFTPYGTVSPVMPLLQDFDDGGVNFGWRHKLSEKTSFGLSVTGGYVAETDPSTHELDETIQMNYSRMVGQWKFELAGGPLMRQVPANAPIQKGDNYVANVGASRKIGHSMVNIAYSHSLQLGFVDGSVLADVVSGTIRHSVSRRFFVGSGGSYQHSNYPGAALNGFIATGTLGYQINRDLIFLANYTHGQQDAIGDLAALGYHRNQYSMGLTYDFTRMFPHRY